MNETLNWSDEYFVATGSPTFFLKIFNFVCLAILFISNQQNRLKIVLSKHEN